jgi:magnesium and cobalt exporter, CNNM family
MNGSHLGGLIAIFLAYVGIAVFRSAYASLSPVALRRILADEGREGSGAVSEMLGIRVAFDVAHHLTLIAGSILLLAAQTAAGATHPYAVGAMLLAAGVVAAQLAARAIAAAAPERAFSATWRVAALLYRPFHLVARPLIAALERLRIAARREWVEEEPEAAAQEIQALIDVGRSEGLLEVEEGRLIRQVVEFHDRVVREIMTPRTEMVAVPASATLRELREMTVASRHSRIPVYRDQIDNIEGVVYQKDLLACWGAADENGPLTPLVRPAFFVPETKQVADLLKDLQSQRTKMAIVVDEYGGTAGLVTLEDLLEEIVGEIAEEHDGEEREISPEGEGKLLVRGTATIDALNAALGTDLLAEGYDTVAGLVYSVLGRIPRAGEVVTHAGVRLEVLKVDSRRINLMRASRTTSPGVPAAS